MPVNIISIGGYSGTEQFNGRVANLKIYSAALTANEIKAEMRQYLPVRTADLNAWTPLLTHTDLSDYSGQGNGWTAAGTLATEDGPPIPWALRPPTRGLRVPVVVPTGRLLPSMMQHA
jgi:hypothetical protein